MTWNEVTYACGHVIREQLYGDNKDRDRHITSALNRQCRDCYRAAITAAAEEVELLKELSPLTGSEKQIEQATRIRPGVLEELEKLKSSISNRKPINVAGEKILAIMHEWVDERINQDSSSWWIENRERDYFSFKLEMNRELEPKAKEIIAQHNKENGREVKPDDSSNI